MGAVRIRRAGPAAGLAGALLLTGCTGPEPAADGPPRPSRTSSAVPSPTDDPTLASGSAGPDEPARPPRLTADDVDPTIAMRTVRHLAGRIGPRHGTSAAYRQAVEWVSGELRRLGYDVRTQSFDVPGGISWGTPVAAGRSTNVVATLPGASPDARWLVVGAHLDTVPQAPGAEDNASGVGVLLAVATAVAERRTRLPVTFVAFGAEEPRGDTDDDHHYGSRAYVASLRPAERSSLAGMVSLDRVGIGAVVPVGSADPSGTDPQQRELVAAARRAGVRVQPEHNRSSDHWSFVRDGLPGVRLGSTPYAGYHSPGDVPAVVQPAQVERVGRVVAAWLR